MKAAFAVPSSSACARGARAFRCYFGLQTEIGQQDCPISVALCQKAPRTARPRAQIFAKNFIEDCGLLRDFEILLQTSSSSLSLVSKWSDIELVRPISD